MSMTIADHLRAFSKAYPIEVFPETDKEKLKQLHIDYPNMSAHIWADAGRNFAKQALEGADELDRMDLRIEKLEERQKILIALLETIETELVLSGSEGEKKAMRIRKVLECIND